MKHQKRSLHRIAYFAQVRNRRALLIGWHKLENTAPQSKVHSTGILTRRSAKPSGIFQKFKASLRSLIMRPDTYRSFPLYQPSIEASIIAKKRFATKLKAIDFKDGKIKVFLGPEVIASDLEAAQRLLDYNGQEYLEIIGELTAAYNFVGADVTWQDRHN